MSSPQTSNEPILTATPRGDAGEALESLLSRFCQLINTNPFFKCFCLKTSYFTNFVDPVTSKPSPAGCGSCLNKAYLRRISPKARRRLLALRTLDSRSALCLGATVNREVTDKQKCKKSWRWKRTRCQYETERRQSLARCGLSWKGHIRTQGCHRSARLRGATTVP